MNLKKRRYHYHLSPKAGSIYCDSSYELKAALLLDDDANVVWYINQQSFIAKKGNKRIYDFLVRYQNGDMKIIEVKPQRRIEQFQEQIEDNKEYALRKGYGFTIWSEQELGFENEYCATKWADEYLSKLDNIDYTEIRKARSLQRTKKHYRKKIATDTVDVFCEYCQCIHIALKLTHDRNVARNNGVYICEKHGGHIAGSKPKKRKEDPLAALGQKQCTGKCQRILSLTECFSKGKSQCKECRAEIYKQRYRKLNN